MEKTLKIGYVLLVMWFKMKYTFLCESKMYDTLRLNIFDSINDSDFVLGIDHKKTFITLMTSTDKKITKAIANFVYDCQNT